MQARSTLQQLLVALFALLAVAMQFQPAAADAGDVLAGLLGACTSPRICPGAQSCSARFSLTLTAFPAHPPASRLTVAAIVVICAGIGWYSRRGQKKASNTEEQQ